MKIDICQVYKDRRGKPVLEQGTDEVTTFAVVAHMALTASFADEPNLSRVEKLRRGRLAQVLMMAKTRIVDFQLEDLVLIKDCVGKGFDPWVVVQTEDMIQAVPESLRAGEVLETMATKNENPNIRD